ncbi:MAG TPA: autotransporter domain-containing protein [Anaeromyxobacter sp.]
MRKVLPLLVLSALAAPLATRADESVALNARAGIAKPFGETSKGEKLGDSITWAYPLQVDLQLRFAKRFSAGAYVRYAPASLDSTVSNACSASGISCRFADLAFGGIAEYRFSERLDGGPWVGALVGYERLNGTQSQAGAKTTSTLTGFELGAQAGVDFELGGLTLGPWASLNVGEFTRAKIESGGVTVSGSIDEKELHGWLQLGVRASLLF